MVDAARLKQVISDLYETPLEAIDSSFSLRHPRLQGSVGRGVLAAAIRRQLGVYAPATFAVQTYGELEAALLGPGAGAGHAPEAGPPPRPEGLPGGAVVPSSNGAISVGVDIEMVDSLPEVEDFWTADFYRTHFTASEIAYCLQQEHPRMHFAARWCAKEALAKCDRRFHAVDPTTVQVAMTEGQPVFERVRGDRAERLPHALSLTHTPLLAAAVVAASSAA